jgi:hypothetical protein
MNATGVNTLEIRGQSPSPDPECNFCEKRHNQPLCKRLKEMAKRNPTSLIGVEKLCSTFPATPDGDSKLTELLDALNPLFERIFLEDLMSGDQDYHVGNVTNIRSLNQYKIKAWELVCIAQPSLFYHRDAKVIARTAILKNLLSSSVNATDDDIVDIIRRNENASCYTCNQPNHVKLAYLGRMDEYLDNLITVNNFYSIRLNDGFSRVINDCKKGEVGTRTIDGAVFGVKMLANSSQVTEIEKRNSSRLPGYSWRDRFTDMIYTNTNGISASVDFKSVSSSFWRYEFPTAQTELNKKKGDYLSKYNQLLDYLLGITSMDRLEYWFDQAKLATETPSVQSNQLTLVGEAIFQTIYNHTPLRRSLLNSLDESPARTLFVGILQSDVNNNVFLNFIQFR